MKSLSKLMKIVVVMMVSIFAVAFLSGCGSTPDKFAGHWIGYGPKGQDTSEYIYDATIEKNGDGNGYLVNLSIAYWDLSPSETGINVGGIHKYKYKWKDKKEKNVTAVANENILTMQGPGSPFFTYIEKDNTLQFTYRNSAKMGAQERIVLHPAGENEAQEFKDKEKSKLKEKLGAEASDDLFIDESK